MATSGGPNISLDGLVFGYDTGYGIADNVTSTRFYPGKPTSNTLETEANWIYLGTNITNPSDYPVSLPAEVNFQKGASQGGISWSDACRNYADSYSAGTKITVSGWHMFHSTDTSLSMNSRDRLGWHYSRDGVSTYGGTIYTATEWNKWYYFSSTFSSTGVTTNLRVEDGGADYYRSSEDAAKTTQYYCNLQIEVGTDVVSPYIKGSRSSTGSLIDLKETTDIDLSNVSFDSTGQPTFDGTDDYLDLGSDVTFKGNGGDWSAEHIVKYDVVPAGYNNSTSPGNFLGGTVNYNSWYWSVLSSKLALWNRSPGVWKYGSTTIEANKFYHVVLVCEPGGTSYKMYLNGVEEGGTNASYVYNASHSGISARYFGVGYAPSTRVVNGKIPVTRIYEKALSATEIKQNFNVYRKRFGI